MSLVSIRLNARCRSGISLMEVLISIGVVAIGLSGLAFLLPVAHHQAESGAKGDRMANVGKRAFREFHVQGMARPDRWRIWNTTYYVQPLPEADAGTDISNPFWFRAPDGGLVRRPLCIDPRAYAAVERFTDEAAIGATTINTAKFTQLLSSASNKEVALRGAFLTFPARSDENEYYFDTLNAPAFGRLTLASTDEFSLGLAPINDTTTPPIPPPFDATAIAGPWPLSKPQADAMFVLGDDLDFVVPDGNELGPVQKTLRASPILPLRRASSERFSWFATLVPVFGFEPATGMEKAMDNDLYRLSIVVCFARNFIEPERFIRAVVRHGIGGGDIILTPDTNVLSDANVTVAANSWVMLANGASRQYRWYRVAQADGINVSLQGADWTPAPLNAPAAARDYLLIVPSVVNVYEKTIHLETSSMWTR